MNMPMQRESNYVNRFFGGPPLSVIFRLILLSVLIGVILQVLGIDPWNIFDSLSGSCCTFGTWALTRYVGSGVICCSALSWWCRSG